MILSYIKAPLNKYTFSVAPIREWVESRTHGKTLNLFAGQTPLAVDEVRNDIDPTMLADYHKDALQFMQEWVGPFETVILDPRHLLAGHDVLVRADEGKCVPVIGQIHRVGRRGRA